MDKLWAPWRVKYITKIVKEPKGCVFCRMIKQGNDKKNFIVARTRHCFSVLNIYPYNNGHLLVIPNRHISELSQLTKNERNDLMDLLEESQGMLEKTMKAQGFNVGMNLGKVAGAGFPGHLHIHIVPRWKGDVNFMSAIAETKVISQSLQALHKILTDAYKNRH